MSHPPLDLREQMEPFGQTVARLQVRVAAASLGTSQVVSVSHDDPDDELTRIQGLLKAWQQVDERWGAEAFIHVLHALPQPAQPQTLDLVAHSTAISRVLAFDGWQMRADQELEVFCTRIEAHLDRFDHLRLIGCATDSEPEGREAIARLSRRLGRRVSGTPALVYAHHFTKGFYDPLDLPTEGPLRLPLAARVASPPSLAQLLADVRAAQPLAPFAHGIAGLEGTRPLVAVLTQVIDPTVAWRLPGLLTRPLFRLRVPNPPRAPAVVDVLFGSALLRLYTASEPEGLVYRITDAGSDALHMMVRLTPSNLPRLAWALRFA